MFLAGFSGFSGAGGGEDEVETALEIGAVFVFCCLQGDDEGGLGGPGVLGDVFVALEIALGDGIKRLTPSEEKNKSVSRKTLVAKRAIKTGEIFSAQNITTKRLGSGISPMRWDEVICRPAPRDFAEDELIEI